MRNIIIFYHFLVKPPPQEQPRYGQQSQHVDIHMVIAGFQVKSCESNKEEIAKLLTLILKFRQKINIPQIQN